MGNFKYLGVQIDRHLAWDNHVHFLRSKVSRAIGFLKYAKKLLSQYTLCKMYRGIIEPHSATAVQSGGHVGGLGCRCCKNFKTVQLEL